MIEPRCGKCGGTTREGFLVDSSHQAVRVAHWASDAPEYWFLNVLKMRGREKLPVRTYRCTKCGYLESYAPAVRPDGTL